MCHSEPFFGEESLRLCERPIAIAQGDTSRFCHTFALLLYNRTMSEFKFFHPIEVRYGDLDPQGHVNNAKYLAYFEQARIYYLIQLGLFSKDQSFMEVGVIIADIHITYHSTTHYGDPIKIGVRTTKIGNKSFTTEQCVMQAETGQVMATGTVVLVTFDYQRQKTISIPEEWKQKISEFEGL
jgi:acyl-CoA thioester hydrolase